MATTISDAVSCSRIQQSTAKPMKSASFIHLPWTGVSTGPMLTSQTIYNLRHLLRGHTNSSRRESCLIPRLGTSSVHRIQIVIMSAADHGAWV